MTGFQHTHWMKVIHIINKKPEGQIFPRGMKRSVDNPDNMVSCCWLLSEGFDEDPSEDDIRSLIGGRVYFHKTKSDRSYYGGQIVDVQPCRWDDPDYPYLEHVDEEEKDRIKKDRYHIEFIPDHDGRGKMWEGKLKYGPNTVIGEVIEVDTQ